MLVHLNTFENVYLKYTYLNIHFARTNVRKDAITFIKYIDIDINIDIDTPYFLFLNTPPGLLAPLYKIADPH